MEKRAQCDRLREYCRWLSCLQRTEHAFSGLPSNIKQINYLNCSLSSKTIVLDEISVADIGPLPAHLPVPTDTVRHAVKIELGNQLFFDGCLSRNNQVSCAYSHIPGSGFSGPHPTSLGVDDLIGGPQAPTVLNAAFTPLLFWDDRAKSLEEQTLGTIQNPIDMAEMLDYFVLKLRNIKGYRRQFLNLFGTEVNQQGIAKAIAAFTRTPNSTNPAFDQYSLGNKQAMNQATIRGMTLFKAEIERVSEGISEKRCQTLRFS